MNRVTEHVSNRHVSNRQVPNRHGTATVTLPSDFEIVITRMFDAAPGLVFRAWTTPAHVARWWSDADAPLVVCDIDLRIGGGWRYVTRSADGTEFGWHGTYREIAAPHRLVSTEVFEGYPDAEALNTMTLTERDGATLLQTTVLHTSKANRDGHVESGMEGGMQLAFDRFEDLVTTMNELAERYRNVADRFTGCVAATPEDAWDRPAPCEGWVARDVVRHLVEWLPPFLRDGAGVELPAGPSVDDDPLGAWRVMSDGVQSLLDDPVASAREFSHPRAGTHRLDQAIATFFLGDVLVHTWDLARSTGQDETLDAVEVEGMYTGMLPLDEMLRQSGQYGARIDVPASADTQTKLIAFTGRQP